jgi:HSP20 family protein
MTETKEVKETRIPTTSSSESGQTSAWRRPFEEMERIYESIFPQGWLSPAQWEMPSWARPPRPFFAHRMPAIDMVDREDEVIVSVEVPGVRKEDLSIAVTDSTLTVKGTTERHEEEKRDDYYYHELACGEFSRVLRLPVGVDSKKVSASLKDGILEIHLPKLESAKRAIDIKIG